MKLLPVLAVVALVASLSESRIVSRCELRERLERAIVLPRKQGSLKESIVAIISCQVERMSHLNSSLVKMHGIHISPPTAKPAPFTTPGNNDTVVDPATVEAKTTMPNKTMTTADDEIRDREDSREDETMNRDTRRKHSRQPKHKKEKLPQSFSSYGIFQLSDRQFCDSAFHSSKNLCRKPCSAFTDDDITDDVECLVKSGYWRNILKKVSRQCYQEAKVYFKECK